MPVNKDGSLAGSDADPGLITTQNFAIFLMILAFAYLTVMLFQICASKEHEIESEEVRDGYYTCSYYYYGDENDTSDLYTNSQYLKGDSENSLVDNEKFNLNQSLKHSSGFEDPRTVTALITPNNRNYKSKYPNGVSR